MKSIVDVIHEKEELLRQRQQQVKMLEEQIAKLRVAVDIIADDDEVIPVSAPEMMPSVAPKANGRAAVVMPTPTATPTKNWP